MPNNTAKTGRFHLHMTFCGGRDQARFRSRRMAAISMTRLAPAICAGLIGLGCFPQAASAQDEDTQFWLLTSASGSIDDDTSLVVDSTYRVKEDARGGDERTFRFLIEQEVDTRVKLGGGIGVFEAAGGRTQIRFTQQAALKLDRLDSRTRLEQRFFDGADQMELRFRQRMRYTVPLARRFSGSVSLEWLHLLQPRLRRTTDRNEFRPQISVSYQVLDNLELGLNYLVIATPREQRPDRLTHIPQVSIHAAF